MERVVTLATFSAMCLIPRFAPNLKHCRCCRYGVSTETCLPYCKSRLVTLLLAINAQPTGVVISRRRANPRCRLPFTWFLNFGYDRFGKLRAWSSTSTDRQHLFLIRNFFLKIWRKRRRKYYVAAIRNYRDRCMISLTALDTERTTVISE